MTSRNSDGYDPETDRPSPLLSIRSAVILLLAALTAAGVVALLLMEGHSGPQATLAGLGALAGAVKFFHWLIN